MRQMIHPLVVCGWLLLLALGAHAGEDPRAIENRRWGDEFGAPIGCDSRLGDAVYGPDGEIYLAGVFRACGGVEANYIVRYEPATGTWTPLGSGGGNGLNGSVSSLLLVDRVLYVTGSFSEANFGDSISANRVAKFDLDTWEWSALGSGAGNGLDSYVYEVVMAVDGGIYFGGEFTQANVGEPVAVNGIARWDPDHGVWSALPGSDVIGTVVYTLHPHGDRLLVSSFGGNVYSYGGGNDWVLLGPGGPDGSAWSIATHGDDIYVGGFFDNVSRSDGVRIPAGGVAKWSSADGDWHALGGGLWQFATNLGAVYDLSIVGERLYVAGAFNYARNSAPVWARGIALWQIGTGQWETVDGHDQTGPVYPTNSYPTVTNVVAENEKLIICGYFDRIEHRNGITNAINLVFYDAKLDVWSTPASVAAHGVWPGGVYGMTTLGGDLYIGGAFAGVSNVYAKAAASWNGQQWRQLSIAPIDDERDVIDELNVFDGKLVVGGTFRNLSSSTVQIDSNVELWDPLTGSSELIGTFVEATIGQGRIWDIAVSGDELYVAGYFSNVTDQHGTIEVNHVARWNRLTRRWSSLGSDGGNGAIGIVSVLHANDDNLFVGGTISYVNAGPAQLLVNNVARWDGQQWHALTSPQGEGTGRAVNAMKADDRYLYVGGDFDSVANGQVPAVRIARWRLDGSAWEPVANGLGADSGDLVGDIVIEGDWVYAGGHFQHATDGTQILGHIARWKPGDSLWSPIGSGLEPPLSGRVRKMVVQGDQLFVAGSFRLAGPNSSTGIARYQLRGALDLNIAGRGSGRVISAPAGIHCTSNCVAQFEWDQDITLTAQPAASSSFAGWSGNCTGAGACVVRFDRARFVQATFDTEADLFANDFE